MKIFLNQCIQFIKKYDFPIHLFILYDIFSGKIVSFFSTIRLKLMLRILGCNYGKRLSAHGKVVVSVHTNGAITLGDNIKFNSRFSSTLAGITNPVVLSCIGNGKISISHNSGCTSAVISSNMNIQIGENVMIGVNTRIFDHDFHSLDHKERRDKNSDSKNRKAVPVIIGDDVFVGANTIILKNVTIGHRSIISAGSVISNLTIPPDSIVAGNPAQILGQIKGKTNLTEKKCNSKEDYQ